MISAGFTISDILDYNSFTFKPNGGLELGVDFSPSSDATYRYLSETTLVDTKDLKTTDTIYASE